MSKTLLMLVGDYAEDYETMVPFQTLQAVGYAVHAVCPGKKAGESVATAIHDFEGAQTYSEARPQFRAELRLRPRRALVLRRAGDSRRPRGIPAPERQGTGYRAGLRPGEKADRGRVPRRAAAAAAGILKGRTCSAYPACAPEVRLAGGTYAEIAIDQAHTDGNLVTAPAWPAHPAWLAQFLAVLGTKITH